ncbi:hypothetical protein [Mycobacterium bourgelatii]|uniref:Uncharacterized protein n=1 Tax=Mycobacterium bourgelatii TaxID=1273442 RepID=A0A7I9YVZ2_MYCBU|nr:hypothetical protein [Mycobacterium bourgelatii]MCV6975283.1 hypothetical protein [Mycobacterium bourgelatii]GFG92869.1 hypothetical protein MBOU_49110 [Mycobacterium bourgelatii]
MVLIQARSEAGYVETIFPGLRPGQTVYVRDMETVTIPTSVRLGSPPPAFGIFQRLVHPDYPLLAILVVKGSGSVESCSLDEALLAYHNSNDSTEYGQQLMNDLAFMEPGAQVDTGRLAPGIGVVVPQVPSRPPLVYRLRAAYEPETSYGPNAFIRYRKFIVPRADPRIIDEVRKRGFVPWRPSG